MNCYVVLTSNVCSARTDGRVGGDVGASAVALPPAKTGPATIGVVDSSFYEAISWPQTLPQSSACF